MYRKQRAQVFINARSSPCHLSMSTRRQSTSNRSSYHPPAQNEACRPEPAACVAGKPATDRTCGRRLAAQWWARKEGRGGAGHERLTVAPSHRSGSGPASSRPAPQSGAPIPPPVPRRRRPAWLTVFLRCARFAAPPYCRGANRLGLRG